MAAQQLRDFLIAFPIHKGLQHLAFQIGKQLVDLGLNAGQILLADVEILRVSHPALDHIQQRAIGFFIIEGLIEGNVAIEGHMLLPGGRLNGGDDLALHAQLRKGAEGGQAVGLKIPDGLIQADHPLLHNVLVIRTDEKIAAGLGANKVFIFIQQIGQGLAVAALGEHCHFLVRKGQEAFVFLLFVGQIGIGHGLPPDERI